MNFYRRSGIDITNATSEAKREIREILANALRAYGVPIRGNANVNFDALQLVNWRNNHGTS